MRTLTLCCLAVLPWACLGGCGPPQPVGPPTRIDHVTQVMYCGPSGYVAYYELPGGELKLLDMTWSRKCRWSKIYRDLGDDEDQYIDVQETDRDGNQYTIHLRRGAKIGGGVQPGKHPVTITPVE